MTPFELVLQHYTFAPVLSSGQEFVPHAKQIEAINDLAPRRNEGHLLDMGVGKTFTATACSLFWKITAGHRTVIVMPPTLIRQWGNWLRTISPALRVVEWRGSPAERAKLSFDADFVLVGAQIFKRDFDRFMAAFDHRTTLVLDEATFIANIGTKVHEKVYDFGIGKVQIALTGTPANKPTDAYGLMKFTAPGKYRNYKHFMDSHVDEYDWFDNPKVYKNLDELGQNLLTNSQRLLFEDLYQASEPPMFVNIDYELDPAHYKLYQKIAEEQMVPLESGGKIDATTAGKLTAILGQLVVNWAHFAEKPGLKSEAIELIEEKLHELGSGKLLIFAHYKRTVEHLTEAFKHVNAVAINGDVTASQKEKNKLRFIEDPSCRLLIVNFKSAGIGVDGLQHVCNTGLFIEPCPQPRDYRQCVTRLKRTGQRRRVVIYNAIAAGTMQVRSFRLLLKNDAILNQVVRNVADLRDLIYGR